MDAGNKRRLLKEIHEVADTEENDKAIALMPLKTRFLDLDPSAVSEDKQQYIELRGIVIAPPGSPIAGYIFFLDIKIPLNYPFEPPKIRFLNNVWHPKVDPNLGTICLDMLEFGWRPRYSLETTLLTIQTLLADVGENIKVHHDLRSLLNLEAAEQYLQERGLFEREALRYAKASNEGYGLASFSDYRTMAVQAILGSKRTNAVYYYKMYAFCTRESPKTCTLYLTVVPNLYMYRRCVEKQYQHYSRITTSYLHTLTNKISISYDGDGFTRDKCWKISSPSELTFTKDDIDRDPQEHQPITCELKLEWVRTKHDPERFLHQFSVIDTESLELIRSFDICIDPQPGRTEIATMRNKRYDERPKLPELIKFGCTSESKPFDITEVIGIRYTRFGIFLLEDDTGSKVQAIKHQMRGESCSIISMEILRRWLEGEGKQPTTWATLIEVLNDCQLVKCADDISTALTIDSESHQIVHNPSFQTDHSKEPQAGTVCTSICSSNETTLCNKKYGERPTMMELLNFQSLAHGSKPFNITEAIGEKYTEFGIVLLEDDTGDIVLAITHQMRGENCSSISLEILRHWLWGKGKLPVTWSTLIEVLNDCQLVKCAQDIKSALDFNSIPKPQANPSVTTTVRKKKYNKCPSIPELLNFQPASRGSKPFNIIKAIGGNYTEFGILLLQDDAGCNIHAIKKEMRGESCSDITLKIIQHWLWGEGKQPTTWVTLVGVLYDCQLVQCADKIKSAFT